MLRRPGGWILLAFVAVVGLIFVLLGPVAWLATPVKHLTGKDKVDAINATRQMLLTALGDRIRLDVPIRMVDLLVDDELGRRR